MFSNSLGIKKIEWLSLTDKQAKMYAFGWSKKKKQLLDYLVLEIREKLGRYNFKVYLKFDQVKLENRFFIVFLNLFFKITGSNFYND